MSGKARKQRRSGCPVSISLEIFGDRWSLLIVRDLMVRGVRTFREFQSSGEGIATNILADRLQKLEAAGIVVAEPEESDGRKINYRLTKKGIDLAPVLLEIFVWAARHEETGASCGIVAEMERHREQVIAEARRRWRERDLTPLIPRVEGEKLKISGGQIETMSGVRVLVGTRKGAFVLTSDGQARKMGGQRPALRGLGDLPPEGIARRSKPDLCVAVERLVRAADPAVERWRQDLGAGGKQVRLRRRPRNAPVV